MKDFKAVNKLVIPPGFYWGICGMLLIESDGKLKGDAMNRVSSGGMTGGDNQFFFTYTLFPLLL